MTERLLNRRRSVGGRALDGEVRFRAEQAVERIALLRAEISGVRFGGGLALIWQIAQVAEGLGDGVLAIERQGVELAHGAGDLLALSWGEPLHTFDAVEDAGALVGRHGVELLEAGADAGLLLRRQLLEAGLALEGLLLLLRGQVLVLLHPLAEVAGRAGVRALRIGRLAAGGLAVAIDGGAGAEGWLIGRGWRGVELLRRRFAADYGWMGGLRGLGCGLRIVVRGRGRRRGAAVSGSGCVLSERRGQAQEGTGCGGLENPAGCAVACHLAASWRI